MSDQHPHPQQPFPQQPSTPEPKKSRKKWPWVVGIVAVVVIIGAAMGGTESGDSTATATDRPAATSSAGSGGDTSADTVPDDEPDEAGLNTPVRDGKFEFVVTGVETGATSVGDNPYLTAEAQGQYTIVSMTVQNISDEPQGLAPTAQKLYDAQGREFSADSKASIAMDSDVPVWDELNPGNTVNLQVVFDMPVDAAPDHIELHDSMFSGGVTVDLT
ncbi:DUF4352 domain-containing protein [Tomitella gaofuii]|uniref:DUF4352 domain-containing protein n=1 Tax=Tomitella gaofuii TaxID=2760083 RepID=UPI0015FD4FE5|nr:DUF4352 domain-containing protein [Tomitella gaofuii]